MKYSYGLILQILFLSVMGGCAQTFSNGHATPRMDMIGTVEEFPADLASYRSDETSFQKSFVELPEASMGDENRLEDESLDETGSDLRNPQVMLDVALERCRMAHEYRQKGNLDEALKSLDRAYSLILEINTDDIPALMQQKEDLRFMISKRILEIYASRSTVVTGYHKAIPITMNKHTQKEIDLFTTGRERKFFIESYKRSGMYRKQIVAEFKAAGLPVELSWLPLIESGFKSRALSKARALGLWQFIPSTGYKFGLKRDTYTDERLDPSKSTQAAIAYLKELHQLFGDWATVLAAYNCGEGRVLRIIRSQNVNYLDNFWDLYEKLPRETARYVPRFLACLHIVNNPEKYGLDQITVDPPLEYETVSVRKQIQLKDAAKTMGISETALTILNPELRYNLLPEKEYFLKVPFKSGAVLLSRMDEIPASQVARSTYVHHRVRPGESLSIIAKRYRTSVSKIVSLNNIRKSSYIVAGTILKIPGSGNAYISRLGNMNKPDLKNGRYQTHRVRQGDSLWAISQLYGTTVNIIQQANNLKNTTLHVGQVLRIPGDGEKQLSSAQADGSRSRKAESVI
ncbi:MAG: LysM peptidoglycan-binding domain-containing protein [Desulfobacterales bacterium]